MTWNGTERRQEDGHLKEVAHEAAHEAVKETFIALGVDVTIPLDMQEDFAFLRRMRHGAEKAGGRVVMTVLTIVVAGLVGLVWTNLKPGG
jgi:hypothetical protein